MTIVIGILSAVMVIAGVGKQGSAPVQDQAEQLVRQLREFRAAIPGMAPSNGALDPLEERRGDVYRRLRELGDAALPALIRGLADRDVELRRNVALFLDAAAGSWFDRSRPRMNILGALPALVTSLDDRDDRVRELAAQAIGEIGPTL